MGYIKRTLYEAGKFWAQRVYLANIVSLFGFIFLVIASTWLGSHGVLFRPWSLGLLALLMVCTYWLATRYRVTYLYNLLADLVVIYLCLALYISSLNVYLLVVLIPLVPLWLYLLNPLWLFNFLSAILLAVLLDMGGASFQVDSEHSDSVELILLAYAVVWGVLLIEEWMHRSNNSRLRAYMHYDEDNKVINQQELIRVLDAQVANSVRYSHKLSLALFEIRGRDEAAQTLLQPGSEYEKRLLTRISSNIRRGDILGKWQGNCFALIVPENSQQGCETLLKKLRGIVQNTLFEGVAGLDMSYGIAVRDSESHLELLARAEQALEQSQRHSTTAGI